MIHHLSIAARDPKQAAGVLAELMGGTAVPFPPNPGSFFALQLDDHGSGVEVYPAGTVLEPGGAAGGNFTKQDARGFGSTHFALSVATDAGAVKAIAERAGWKCFDCNRGPFHVIEVWVENETMVEVLPPEVRGGISGLYPAGEGSDGDGGGGHLGGTPRGKAAGGSLTPVPRRFRLAAAPRVGVVAAGAALIEAALVPGIVPGGVRDGRQFDVTS